MNILCTSVNSSSTIPEPEKMECGSNYLSFQKDKLLVMQHLAVTRPTYLQMLPAERQHVVERLREAILKNSPEGFEETMNYGMIG